MKGGVSSSPFRVFGSPYTLPLHQHVTYLRLKQLPFKVYCTNFTTTFLYSLYYRARNCFCTLTPNNTSCVQVWQLAETVELDEDAEAIARTAKGEVEYSTSSSGSADKSSNASTSLHTQQLLLSKATHPNLHLASWCVVVYSCWWLAKTGVMYRYVRGESLDVLEGYLRYFFLVGGIGFARSMAPRFRQLMKQVVMMVGVSDTTAPYIDDHFMRFCTALEAHLHEHPTQRFLLGTPHPTLADVTLGAAFSSFFLMDDPPSATLAEKFPCVTEYVERVTGWRGSTFVDLVDEGASHPAGAATPATPAEGKTGSEAEERDLPGAPRAASSSSTEYPDVVPESLAPCFELIAEVFPFLMSQCASFTAFMAGDGVRKLRREPLEGEWKGCHGYLLPQLTDIKSLMIVDDDVSSVLVRSQDLEVAFLASREVNDDALRDFGRHDDNAEPAKPPFSPVLGFSEKYDQARAESRRLRTAASAATGATDSAAAAARQQKEKEVKESGSAAAAVVPSTPSHTAAEPGEGGNAVRPPSPASEFAEPLDLNTICPDDADFYRAYSAAGRRRLGGGATSLSAAMPKARHVTGAASHAVLHRSSVLERLEMLRGMLAKMSCPQYTLTTVFHARRMYVAVIPEYEVAKVRRARQETMAAAKAAAERASSQRSSGS
ncbi:Glutathione S-transferase C-terminal domain containing protein [Lotmaria passim]